MDINGIYKYLKTLAPLAPLTPDQFNQIAAVVTDTLTEELYGAIYKQQQGRLLIAYEQTQSLQDALRHLETSQLYPANVTGWHDLPKDYRHGLGVGIYINGKETPTTDLEQDKWANALLSTLVPPTENPVHNYIGSKFRVQPAGFQTRIYYLKTPATPYRNYTVSGAYDTYNPVGSVQFPFPDFCDPLIVRLMLRELGQTNEQWRTVENSNFQLKNMA